MSNDIPLVVSFSKRGMFMRKELEHFYIGEALGGSQDWFMDPFMKLGGCGAVTACDICIWLARS